MKYIEAQAIWRFGSMIFKPNFFFSKSVASYGSTINFGGDLPPLGMLVEIVWSILVKNEVTLVELDFLNFVYFPDKQRSI